MSMSRRKAMFLAMLGGGVLPASLLAQDPARRSNSGRLRSASLDEEDRPKAKMKVDDPLDAEADFEPSKNKPKRRDTGTDSPAPEDFPAEAGRNWKDWDITPYTTLASSKIQPQTAMLDWIFRRTGSAPWHDDKISVLSASRTRIKAFHTAKVLAQVDEIVDRFINSVADLIQLRVRIIAAPDTRWRYTNFTRMQFVGTGGQGQRIWTLSPEESSLLINQLTQNASSKVLGDKTFKVLNGQSVTMDATVNIPYLGSLQRDNAVGLGFQPKTEQITEGVVLKMSPLLTFDDDAVDLAVELTANTVRSLHRTRVIAPREVGNNDASIDVPEVAGSRLDRPIKAWPLGKTLLISAGILPGILLPNKNGLWNLRLPGTVPSETELLLFIEGKALERTRTSRDDRER